jgi:hypothetical protein
MDIEATFLIHLQKKMVLEFNKIPKNKVNLYKF